ncbi:hypothetical protein BRDID11002_59360 [Bradyrhizobium diazoefficiens]|uniref:Uncharacterized protein n=1 Tax=Bradyrhizobium diazoefficiens TaxID=1355477 RepID=A0A809WSM1_9BRAD|nr:hypothetical protein XF1B_04760 [Bradyrhizobium diazoefficiens]BCF22523.1 hypothetical protein XF14B_04750 [Bradyrhizobium diazoefficiens]
MHPYDLSDARKQRHCGARPERIEFRASAERFVLGRRDDSSAIVAVGMRAFEKNGMNLRERPKLRWPIKDIAPADEQAGSALTDRLRRDCHSKRRLAGATITTDLDSLGYGVAQQRRLYGIERDHSGAPPAQKSSRSISPAAQLMILVA